MCSKYGNKIIEDFCDKNFNSNSNSNSNFSKSKLMRLVKQGRVFDESDEYVQYELEKLKSSFDE